MTNSVLGTCHHDCPDSCGWVATVDDGVAVKLRGNPDHPYSAGELCPKVNRFLDRVYSPDRVLTPLIRSGPKGTGTFSEVSWDDALGLVAERLHAVIAEWGGEAILPWWDAGTQGLLQMSSLDRRLFAALGASRLTGSLCGATASAGTAVTLGSGRGCDPSDVEHARYIVLWGTNTRLTNRHLWPFVERARSRGAVVVVIDPIRTVTAEAADWFLQPRPGTDVALMLAMMHVLVRDGLIDDDYVERHTRGFDELAGHVSAWTPARAAGVTGVDAADIERLATEYGTIRPAFIRTLIGAEHHENGAMFFRALSCLPTLTGSWRERGGGYARSVGTWFDTQVDDSVFDPPPDARRALNMNHLGRVLTDRSLDPPVKALVVWNGNPAVTVPNAAAIRQGLADESLFTIVSEQFITDTVRFADVVFPATTQLEQRDVVPAWGHLYLGWNEAAIAPRGDAVPNTELWRRLAAAMGFTDPALFEDDDTLLQKALPTLDFERLRGDGFVRLDLPTDLRPYANGGFDTADGKASLGSPLLPDYVPAAEGPGGDPDLVARYPLTLLTPKQHQRFLNSSYTHLPKHGPAEGGPYVEIHEVDAAARALGEGDEALVFNDRARLSLTIRLSDRVRPGVVAVPFGWWSDDHGDGEVANSLTSAADTDWGGGVAYSDTLVQVASAAAG